MGSADLSALCEGEGAQGLLLGPALGKRAAGHSCFELMVTLQMLLLLLTPEEGYRLPSLEAVTNSCHFSASPKLLHHPSQHQAADSLP